jgi:hypothetical protein
VARLDREEKIFAVIIIVCGLLYATFWVFYFFGYFQQFDQPMQK